MSELRKKVEDAVYDLAVHDYYDLGPYGATKSCVDRIAEILEDTGAPAYMRVAADLRGEVAGED